jgi:hypothetical protein
LPYPLTIQAQAWHLDGGAHHRTQTLTSTRKGANTWQEKH